MLGWECLIKLFYANVSCLHIDVADVMLGSGASNHVLRVSGEALHCFCCNDVTDL